MKEFQRINRLPPYVLNIVNQLKIDARKKGEDIIDFGMGNPDQKTPDHIIDKMKECANKDNTHRYSSSKGIPRLRKAISNWYLEKFSVDIDFEKEAIVTIGSKDRKDPNVRATTQELYNGLEASGQNAFPNVNFDLAGINNYLGRFFAAGFYYKTFMGIPPFEWGRGTAIWMFFEKFIRKAAGMGSASELPDPDSYEHAHDFCDLIVVGSGPAGVAAAIEAAEKKLDVILVEQDNLVGGDQLAENNFDNSQIKNQLENLGIKIMTRTTAFGLYDNCVVGLLERVTDHISAPNVNIPRQRFWTIRAKHIIVGAGAIERHIAFNLSLIHI